MSIAETTDTARPQSEGDDFHFYRDGEALSPLEVDHVGRFDGWPVRWKLTQRRTVEPIPLNDITEGTARRIGQIVIEEDTKRFTMVLPRGATATDLSALNSVLDDVIDGYYSRINWFTGQYSNGEHIKYMSFVSIVSPKEAWKTHGSFLLTCTEPACKSFGKFHHGESGTGGFDHQGEGKSIDDYSVTMYQFVDSDGSAEDWKLDVHCSATITAEAARDFRNDLAWYAAEVDQLNARPLEVTC